MKIEIGSKNKWIRYPIYIIIGGISGVISSYGLAAINVELVYKPPLVFWVANMFMFYNVSENLGKYFILLLRFYAIYLPITFPYGGFFLLSMPIGGALTLWSYRIIGIKIKDRTILICALILFVLGTLELSYLFYERGDGNNFPNYFHIVIVSWQTVVLTTVAISVQKAKEGDEKEEEGTR